jgi:hypothetical protein
VAAPRGRAAGARDPSARARPAPRAFPCRPGDARSSAAAAQSGCCSLGLSGFLLNPGFRCKPIRPWRCGASGGGRRARAPKCGLRTVAPVARVRSPAVLTPESQPWGLQRLFVGNGKSKGRSWDDCTIKCKKKNLRTTSYTWTVTTPAALS